ncbi:hypothetical protein DRZ78_01785 [Candidatus Aerophobetes bacterium]|uniref:TFIIB-type domain-containing protein n=1 Tax=Aerophobetes bacterium TaxID=2030807 RepID=A0A662D3J0_UNCAE|nr:MAG: hypothetical protein DRZ78_01785 [Candidatus Aerophobetes bacterium]
MIACPRCGKRFIYARRDGKIRCWHCGYIGKREEFQLKSFPKKPIILQCPECGGKRIYTRWDGSRICRKCGFTGKEEFEVENKKLVGVAQG